MNKLVGIGHSVMKGTDYGSVTSQDTFLYKVGISLGFLPGDIVNKGVSGDTSSSLLSRLQSDALSLNPSVLAVMIGANDWVNGVSIDAFKQNLRQIISAAKDSGAKVVIISDNMNRGSSAQFITYGKFIDVQRQVAYEFGVGFVDVFSPMCYQGLCGTHVQYYAGGTDVIHYSKLGHTFAASIMLQPWNSGYFTAQ